jgi:hypothetical protein
VAQRPRLRRIGATAAIAWHLLAKLGDIELAALRTRRSTQDCQPIKKRVW